MKITKDFCFFWRSSLGNWSKSPEAIEYDGKSFPTSEHVFMYIKAKIFGDEETAQKILETTSPKEAKDLGRRVKGFNENTWSARRVGAMYDALMARAKYDIKFRNNIVKIVKDHENNILFEFVEASPYDTIWGVGLGEEDPRILDKKNWRGLNLLGNTMTRVANWWLKESRLNTWNDTLLWCPSQCYYEFRDKHSNELKCLYLRWRHSDPWTAEIIPVNEIDRKFSTSGWENLNPPFFKDTELDKLKDWSLKKLKELDLI